ncbi:hypothetical protein [Leminorella grimontii]|uniref:hypothetical protein n=1 Tax=Leminorella grimontii TaxID=82981 RepID=UPI003220494F
MSDGTNSSELDWKKVFCILFTIFVLGKMGYKAYDAFIVQPRIEAQIEQERNDPFSITNQLKALRKRNAAADAWIKEFNDKIKASPPEKDETFRLVELARHEDEISFIRAAKLNAQTLDAIKADKVKAQQEIKAKKIKGICRENSATASLLNAGFNVKNVYVGEDNQEIISYVVTARECEKLQENAQDIPTSGGQQPG